MTRNLTGQLRLGPREKRPDVRGRLADLKARRDLVAWWDARIEGALSQPVERGQRLADLGSIQALAPKPPRRRTPLQWLGYTLGLTS